MTDDDFFMRQALLLAERADSLNEVPVGALVVCEGKVIGEGWNQPITGCDPTAHAEVMALRQAAQQLGNYRLAECTLYVTIEPCSMCAGAMVHARIGRVVYGATEPKAGVVESQQSFFEQDFLNHRVEVCGGVLADECRQRISRFFQRRRALKKALKKGGDNLIAD